MLRILGSYGLARASAGLGLFLTTVLLVNAIGQVSYGEFGHALVVLQTVAYICVGWVGFSAGRIMPGLESRNLGAWDHVMARLLVLGALVSAVVVALLSRMQILDSDPLFLTAALIFLAGYIASEYALVRANVANQLRSFLAINLIRFWLPFFGALGFWGAGLLETSTAILVLGIAALASVYPAASVVRSVASANPKGEPPNLFRAAKKALLLGIPAVMLYGLWPLTSLINRVAIDRTAEASVLGTFVSSTDLVNGPITLLFQIILYTWGAKIMGEANQGREVEFRKLVAEMLGMVLLVISTGAVALWSLGPPLVIMLLPPEISADTFTTVRWVVLNTLAINAFVASCSVLIAMKRIRLAVALAMITLIINGLMVLNAPPDASSKAQYAAMSTLSGAALMTGLALFLSKVLPERRLTAASILSAVLVASIVAAIDLFRLSVHPLVTGFILAIVVAVIATCLNVLDVRALMLRQRKV